MAAAPSPAPAPAPATASIDAVRAFTRFYTNKIGVLRGGLHGSRHPLPEARVLFELGAGVTEVAQLRETLDMDAGQLSRLLARLDDEGLITRERSAHDARRQVLALTAAGRKHFQRLDRGAIEQWSALLADLPEAERARMLGGMRAVQEALDGAPPRDEAAPVVLRDLRSGDYGWIIARHGVLYLEEYGWGLGFEALVARVVADFAEHGAGERFARGWIAEVDGAPAGCILSVDGDQDGDAKLRLLLVEPWARGLGVGGRLIDAVIAHARARDARRVVLWTNHPLVDARRLYERRGFTLIAEEPHTDWDVPLTGQVLALEL